MYVLPSSVAQTNISSDSNLPSYFIIKNQVLIACALDDCDEANAHRALAEQEYWICTQASFFSYLQYITNH